MSEADVRVTSNDRNYYDEKETQFLQVLKQLILSYSMFYYIHKYN